MHIITILLFWSFTKCVSLMFLKEKVRGSVEENSNLSNLLYLKLV